MSRAKGRTRQGKKKTLFFAKSKGRGAKNPRHNMGSGVTTTATTTITTSPEPPAPTKQQIVKKERHVARQAKMDRQEQAGAIAKPTPSKKMFIRHKFDTLFRSPNIKNGSPVVPANEDDDDDESYKINNDNKDNNDGTVKSRRRPGMIASSLNRISAMSPLKLIPLKSKPRGTFVHVPPVVGKSETIHTPKSAMPGIAPLLAPAPPSSIVKLWADSSIAAAAAAAKNNNNSVKKVSLLPPTTPSESITLGPVMPSVMASPIVATWQPAIRRSWTPRRHVSTPRRAGTTTTSSASSNSNSNNNNNNNNITTTTTTTTTTTPLSRYMSFTLPALFAKEAVLEGKDIVNNENNGGTPRGRGRGLF